MTTHRNLVGKLGAAAARHGAAAAVTDGGTGTTISYRQLAVLSDRVRDRLLHTGVLPGDRVGLFLPKSIDAIVALLGVMKAGAAYVPVDPEAPARRGAFILSDCAVHTVIADTRLTAALAPAMAELDATPQIMEVNYESGPVPIEAALDAAQQRDPATAARDAEPRPDDLAYILYTSGSTGQPKGVRLTHRAALTFVGWCEAEFTPRADDVYSSHAPLHFDLSIHDVFVSLANGARLVLIGEELGRDPVRLAALIADERISVWYSTPSILNLLAQYGRLDRVDASALRLVLFAGEVFPIPQLRRVKELWPHPRFYNLYGPTETNVCTYFEVPRTLDPDTVEPFPIGRMCPPLRGRVIDESGADAAAGEEGELVVAGPGLMDGYWNLPELTARAFLTDEHGERWYRTGDIVREDDDGLYRFHGRRDRMVKRRGFRVELGEIEAGLAGYPGVQEVAVVAIADTDHGLRIRAYLRLAGETRPSIIALKNYCVERLPRYMVPDTFEFVGSLPRTSTDKIDYRSLLARD
jgi:amino acid adenylation domain-containing protein